MKKLILLFTLLVMSSSAFAATYLLKSQRVDSRAGLRYCHYNGGYIVTVKLTSYCPYRITR